MPTAEGFAGGPEPCLDAGGPHTPAQQAGGRKDHADVSADSRLFRISPSRSEAERRPGSAVPSPLLPSGGEVRARVPARPRTPAVASTASVLCSRSK